MTLLIAEEDEDLGALGKQARKHDLAPCLATAATAANRLRA